MCVCVYACVCVCVCANGCLCTYGMPIGVFQPCFTTARESVCVEIVSMCVCMRVYACACVCACVYACVYACACAYACVCVCVFVAPQQESLFGLCLCECACMCMCAYVYVCVYAFVYVCECVCVRAYECARVCVCTYGMPICVFQQGCTTARDSICIMCVRVRMQICVHACARAFVGVYTSLRVCVRTRAS